MYLDDPDIELLDDDFEQMAPFLDLSWSTDEPLDFDTLPRPLDAWRDKFKDRGAITAARKQDYAERMRSIVISSQKWMEIYLGVDIEKEQYTPSRILGCSASLHTRLDFGQRGLEKGLVVLDPKERKSVENAVRSLAALGLNNDTAPLAIQQAYDEADAQAEERFLLDVIVTANESLPGRAQIIRLPSLLRHESRQLALDLKSLIQHRRAHQCFHLRAVLLKGRHGATTSTSQVSDPTSKANLSKHGEMHSSVLRGLVHSMGAARLEAVSGVARSIRWTGQATFIRFSTANETENIGYIEDRRKEVSCNCALHIWPRECSSIMSILAQIRMPLRARQYTAFAKIPPFGSIDGNVTSATPLKIGSLVCFVLK
ncbi:BQ5605_C005g03659 [Microbotryum silenes-dioicae]|uniref:BQ5605_C005g03659 protein n=1 Tax=Microbotryum silenes-dioicae TaxID=796604 RepID=A0A2X0MFI1_9BASI|nr:BQ5605_C005g03659 [Microbotryum silenes-dioicae]